MTSKDKKMSPEQIHDYWRNQAIRYGQSQSASWSDNAVIEMEIREILKYITDGDNVLDIGCGNGYSTVKFASQKKINMKGIDYVPEMIEQARSRMSKNTELIKGTIEFDIGDIIAMREQSDTYDKVIVIRVLINLRNWETQLKALNESIRILKHGGLLILSEATIQGWSNMNRFRNQMGLCDIPMPTFNQYIDQEQVIKAVSPNLQLVELNNFSSTYYVGTRVIKPLVINSMGTNIDVANPDMDWNYWFSQLPSWGDYGTQKLFIFRKV